MSLFEITEIIGTVAFTLSGFMVGVRKNLDILGLFIVSFLTALGGGLIRDTLVGSIPYSLKHTFPVVLVTITFATAIFLKLYKKATLDQHALFIIADSIGLVSFSITGSLIGLSSDISFFGVIVLSFLTAVGGGIVRDILINEVPFVLNSDFYGTVAIFTAGLMMTLHSVKMINGLTVFLVFSLALFLRIYAYRKKWQLPVLQ